MQRLRAKQQEHKDRQYHQVKEMRLALARGDRDLADKLRARVRLPACLCTLDALWDSWQSHGCLNGMLGRTG